MTSPSVFVRSTAGRPDLLLAAGLASCGLFRAAEALPARLPNPIVFSILVASCAYLAFHQRILGISRLQTRHRPASFISSDVVFALAFTAALLIWHRSLYTLPPTYFIAPVVAAGTVLWDVASERNGPQGIPAMLVKVLMLGLLIRIVAYVQFPGPIGSDPWRHVLTIQSIADTGHVVKALPDALGTSNGYAAIPVFHILAAAAGQLTGAGAKAASFIAASVPLVLSMLSVFLIGRSVHSSAAGVLATLLYCVADFSVLWGVQVIAMTLAAAIAACLIWLLLSGRARSPSSIASALLMLATLILCHTVAAFVVLVALAAVVASAGLLRLTGYGHLGQRTTTLLSSSLVAPYGVFMLVWWMTMPTSTGDTFFAVQAGKLAQVLTTSAESQVAAVVASASRPYALLLFDTAGTAILIGLGLLAALAAFNPRRAGNRLMVLTIAVGALVALQAVGSSSLQEAVIGARWVIFQYMFLAAMAAWVLSPLLSRFSSTAFRLALVAIMCVAYVLPMLTNSTANQSNPFWTTTTPRTGYTTSEQTAWGTLVTDMRVKPVGDGYYIGAMATMTSAADYGVLSTSNTELLIERGNYLARPELNEVHLSVIGDIRDVNLGFYRLEGQPVFITGYAAEMALTGGVVYANDTTRMVQLTS
jgi:hypothetical protein